MKKFWNVLKKVLLGILAFVLVFMGGVWTYDQLATKSDEKKIAAQAYGQRVDVDGKKMNVTIYGDGEKVIALFPGWGTPSPVIDFKPVIEGLKDEYKVVVVEPFGYGLSDRTDEERTKENIVKDYHDALAAVGVTEFYYMGHSIAGLYGLEYANTYPEEMKGFIGIDTSVSGQFTAPMPTGLFSLLRNTGFMRFQSLFAGEPTNMSEGLTPEEIKLMGMISNKQSMNKTMLDELSHLDDNLNRLIDMRFPTDMPIYLFVQEINPNQPDWQKLHYEQAASVENGHVTLIDGDHYLHHENGPQIVRETKAFLDSLK